MASGITHMLLVSQLADKFEDGEIRSSLQAGSPFLIAGSVGQDLPYASIADSDYFFKTEEELAEKFHEEKTNQVVLLAFREIKKKQKKLEPEELDALFNFFTGFATHIIADGIIHPFVRDKVGDYKTNQSAHRALEMKLDVIYLDYITRQTGKALNFNSTNIHDELLDILTYPFRDKIFILFSKLVKKVYGLDYSPETIEDWVVGLHKMFNIAEGEHPKIYKNLPLIKGYIFQDIVDLKDEAENICTLHKPVDGLEYNFLRRDKVHFINDCVPQFYKTVIPIISKLYNYIYRDGQELTNLDLLAVDLDTGRDLVFNNDLDQIPGFWKGAV